MHLQYGTETSHFCCICSAVTGSVFMRRFKLFLGQCRTFTLYPKTPTLSLVSLRTYYYILCYGWSQKIIFFFPRNSNNDIKHFFLAKRSIFSRTVIKDTKGENRIRSRTRSRKKGETKQCSGFRTRRRVAARMRFRTRTRRRVVARMRFRTRRRVTTRMRFRTSREVG